MFQAGYFYFSPVTFAYSEEIEVSQSSGGDTGVSSAEWTAAPLTGLRAWAPWWVDCGPHISGEVVGWGNRACWDMVAGGEGHSRLMLCYGYGSGYDVDSRK